MVDKTKLDQGLAGVDAQPRPEKEPDIISAAEQKPPEKRQSGAQRRRELKLRLCGEQNWRCAYCGKPMEDETASIDHVIARSRGGSNEWENLVAAHRQCNEDKGRTSYLDHIDGIGVRDSFETIRLQLSAHWLIINSE